MRRCWAFAVAWGIVILVSSSQEVAGQRQRITKDDVGRLYVEARFKMQYSAFVRRHGVAVSPRQTERLTVASDSLVEWIRSRNPDLFEVRQSRPWSGQVDRWALVSPDERLAWLGRFSDVEWAFLGNNYFTALDTVETPEIRARMQGYFGIPTQTIVERSPQPTDQQEDYVQFEYWFIVNDSLPLVVTDVDGPFDRGVLVEGDHRHRQLLYRMRQSLLASVMREAEPAAFADYYYHASTEAWYSTGFDGAEYFLRRIRPPNLARGRPEQPAVDGN